VPIYNHGYAIKATIDKLKVYGAPIYIIDDGSNDDTKRSLIQLMVTYPDIRILVHHMNQGKGAALKTGFRQAVKDGFTHGLQIDADGQHTTTDVPAFFAKGRQYPQSLICGEPVYDDSIPKSRLYGRRITNFWVAIETLSLQMPDAMCGYRLYPLRETISLLDRYLFGDRMEFDIEILVRFAWQPLPIYWIKTAVRYPEGGQSTFRLFFDNVRISWAHTRLVFGMAPHVPLLLKKRQNQTQSMSKTDHWSALAERGSSWGLSFTFAIYRIFGRALARLLLIPITLWFFMTGTRARRASREYLKRVHRAGALDRAPTILDSFRHFRSFAGSALDKVDAWIGNIAANQIAFPNHEELETLARSGRGALFITAHIGNIELARAIGAHEGLKRINAIVYTEHAKKFNALINKVHPKSTLNLIHISSFGVDMAVHLKKKIDAGEWLFIVGDRTPVVDNRRIVEVPFLGSIAPFATGPYVLAHLMGCKVYLIFCLRELDKFHIYLEPFADKIELPHNKRQEEIKRWATRYAERLTYYTLRSPYQWFNFYNYWERN
jgi:predicted LPLAT superfamily acyltransferase